MQKKRLIDYGLLCLCLTFHYILFGQSVVNTTGATLKNNDFIFEYSIGEISITTISGNENAVTQGLLQPKLKTTNPGCTIINSSMLSFENPTRNKVRLVGRYDWITQYHIYAADGKLVRIARFQNNYIDISTLPAAVYFIRLLPGCDGKYRTLKIMKQ